MKLRSMVWLTPAVALLAGSLETALAAPVDIGIEPPTMVTPVKTVCKSRVSESDMLTFWTNWDKKALPDRSATDITRDMSRLRDIDAVQYEGIITRIIALLPVAKKNYGPAEALLDRIRLLIAMGNADTVRDEDLISQLIAMKGQSPKNRNLIANYIIDGLDRNIDPKTGMQMKVEAALKGNPEAMLDLVQRVQNGEKIAGWDIDSKLAVNLAYATLIGNMDENICDRISRVARDYESGKIVARNIPLAVRWLRLAADLGDSDAAWKVAEYYLDGEDVATDAKALFTFLNRSVTAKNDAAVLALAGMYKEGALVEQDVDRALALYDQAIALNNKTALLEKVKMLAGLQQNDAKYAEPYTDALIQLLATGKAPAWAHTRMARLIQSEKGFWAAMPEALPLLEKAAAEGDVEAKIDLGEVLIAQNADAIQPQRRAVDLFSEAFSLDGQVRAVENLVNYYRCIQPDTGYETYWAGIRETVGNDSVDFDSDQLAALSPQEDFEKVASLQTQALYNRGRAIAIFSRYLAQSAQSEEAKAFWKARRKKSRNGELEEMLFAFQAYLNAGQIDLARQTIQPAGNDFNPDAGVTFAKFLLENYLGEITALELVKEILRPLADKGFGRAIQLLISIDNTKKLADFAGVMADRGDMVSQLMLAETATTDDLRKLYLQRAVGINRCNFGDAVLLGEYALRFDPERAERWLETAGRMADQNNWLQVKVADLFMASGTNAGTKKALDLYIAGHAARENSASFRLVKFYSDRARPEYNPQRASDIFVDLIIRSEVKDIPERLAMLTNMRSDIRRQVSLRLNIPALYRKAAEANEPVAMREYGKILRGEDAAANSAEAFNWLQRAAGAGDGEAMFLVSQSYAFGMGVKPSDEQAREWLTKAADSGFGDALKLRALMTNIVKTEG